MMLMLNIWIMSANSKLGHSSTGLFIGWFGFPWHLSRRWWSWRICFCHYCLRKNMKFIAWGNVEDISVCVAPSKALKWLWYGSWQNMEFWHLGLRSSLSLLLIASPRCLTKDGRIFGSNDIKTLTLEKRKYNGELLMYCVVYAPKLNCLNLQLALYTESLLPPSVIGGGRWPRKIRVCINLQSFSPLYSCSYCIIRNETLYAKWVVCEKSCLHLFF